MALRLLKEAKTGDDVGRAADVVKLWSQRIVEAETDPADPASHRTAARDHLQRMKSLVFSAQENIGTDSDATFLVMLNVLYYRAEAERLLKTAEAAPRLIAPADALDCVSLQADEITLTASGDVTAKNVAAPAGQGRPHAGRAESAGRAGRNAFQG